MIRRRHLIGYLPAASRYRERAADDGAVDSSLLRWKQDLDRHWSTVRFGAVGIETHDGQHFFRVEVSPGNLKLEELRVELYSNPVQGGGPALIAMSACKNCAGSSGAQMYSAHVSATRPATDYNARIVRRQPNASTPLEAVQIVWQR